MLLTFPLLLCLIAIVGLAMLSFLVGLLAGRRKVVRWSTGTLTVLLGGWLASTWVRDVQIKESKARGDQVARALHDFGTARGAYPRALGELVPAFLPAIPDPCTALWTRQAFLYRCHEDRTGFVLEFQIGDLLCLARAEEPEWEFDDWS